MNKSGVIIGITFIVVSLTCVSYAEVQGKESYFKYGFKELGLFCGFHRGKLRDKEHYEVIPAMLHLGFDMRPVIRNHSGMLMEFLLEPFINTVITPDCNIEVGNNFLLKFAYPVTKKLYPYLEGGCGLIYLTQQTREQATQFNFTDQIGCGLTYFFTKNSNISVGYRLRHISNAAIKQPNKGMNADSLICGVSFVY